MEFTDQPLEPFGEQILNIAIPTQLSYKTPLVYRIVKELTKREYLPWTGSHRAELCMDEALTNAMLHGNKLDAGKKVHVVICGDADRWGVIIEDEGNGFGPEQLVDPDSDDFLLEESGRGILLMQAYVDTLQYNRRGTRLLMTRKRQSEPDEVEALAAVGAEEVTPPAASEEIVTVSQESGIQIIEIQPARVDDSNVDFLKEALGAIVGKGAEIILDMNRVGYISSVGLSALVSVYKRIRNSNGHLLLTALQAGVSDILESAYLLKLFQTAPDREQAVKAMKKLI